MINFENQILLINKALSDDNRIEIVKLLSKSSEKICACELLKNLEITQPTLSHHMKILSEADLVDSIKKGKWTYYSLNENVLHNLVKFYDGLIRREE